MLVMSADAAYMLDKKMSEIRMDILLAEDFSRNRENIVNNILSNIRSLSKSGRLNEAKEYNQKFINIHKKGNYEELLELQKQINKKVIGDE